MKIPITQVGTLFTHDAREIQGHIAVAVREGVRAVLPQLNAACALVRPAEVRTVLQAEYRPDRRITLVYEPVPPTIPQDILPLLRRLSQVSTTDNPYVMVYGLAKKFNLEPLYVRSVLRTLLATAVYQERIGKQLDRIFEVMPPRFSQAVGDALLRSLAT